MHVEVHGGNAKETRHIVRQELHRFARQLADELEHGGEESEAELMT